MNILREFLNVSKDIKFHDYLNPALWDDDRLKSEVRRKLVDIANTFLDSLKIARSAVTDVVITGSNCQMNYTEFSDIDLHLIIDFDKLNIKCADFIAQYFRSAKTVWNSEHDIKIYDYDVELYAQDSREEHTSNGIFSIINNSWIVKPSGDKKYVDKKSISIKAESFMNMIDDLIDNKVDEDQSARAIKEKISKMRKAGLHERGEFSEENLVFKILRNRGYLDKLDQYFKRSIDDELSLTESPIPNEWDKSKFSDDKSFGETLLYAKSKAKVLSKSNGSGRVPIKVDYNNRKTILKIATNHAGLAQNETEVKILSDDKFSKILIPMIDYDDKNEKPVWIHVERATRMTPTRFEHLMGYQWNEFKTVLFLREDIGSQFSKIFNDNLYKETIELLDKYNLMMSDISSLDNWGEYKNHPVLLDVGLDVETFENYYKNKKKASYWRPN